MQERINYFRLNHIGYPARARKQFVYTGEPCKTFTVYRIQNVAFIPVFTGTFVPFEDNEVSPACCMGDFSSVTEEGVYRIHCGENRSRSFFIGGNIYDSACRVMTQYFVWQRCGDTDGYNGPCHLNDHLTDKYGVDHHIFGGHHQSGDLRKWSFGCPMGVYGLSEYLLLTHPIWNHGTIEFDVAHSARYYLSRLSREGYIFDSTFLPADYREEVSKGVGLERYDSWWGPIRYYDTPTDPQGHWFVIRMLASAARSLKETNPAFAEECLAGAEKIWNYMQTEGEFIEDFRWTEYPPIGHDGFKEALFDYYYPGSTFMLTGRAYAAMDLYKTTGNEAYQARAAETLRTLSGRSLTEEDGALIYYRLGDRDNRIAEGIRYFVQDIPLVFADALSVWPEHPDAALWKQQVASALLKYEKQAAANAYGRTASQCTPDDVPARPEWHYYAGSFVGDLANTTQFLCKAAPFMGVQRCLGPAQRLIDFAIGANPADSSAIEGVGHNQPIHEMIGECYPSQPKIPGGVFTDIVNFKTDFNGGSQEYDMPLVGELLYALALYQKLVNEL